MDEKNKKKKYQNYQSGPAGAVYFFGFVGALIYFIQTATDFWDGALGFLQSLVWPAFVVYKLLEFFKI